MTYVGNVVHALLLAADKLSPGAKSAGQAYFITNDAPVSLWDTIGHILMSMGFNPPSIAVPYGVCMLGRTTWMRTIQGGGC